MSDQAERPQYEIFADEFLDGSVDLVLCALAIDTSRGQPRRQPSLSGGL
jgi:hypothetical protein